MVVRRLISSSRAVATEAEATEAETMEVETTEEAVVMEAEAADMGVVTALAGPVGVVVAGAMAAVAVAGPAEVNLTLMANQREIFCRIKPM